jgi:hypothetical protein
LVSVGHYAAGALLLAVLTLSLGFSAVSVRRRLLPDWHGAPARLVESVVALALLIWLCELLGSVNLLYSGLLVVASVLVAVGCRLCMNPSAGPHRRESSHENTAGQVEGFRGPFESPFRLLIAVAVIAVVVGHWAITTKHALDGGIFNFDSLWYHLPFAADMVQSHSLTGLHYTDTVFTNWLYPQNAEVLHAVGMLLTGRDTLSLFINLGWLGLSFLAAWCIGRPYGRGPLTVVAAAILLECHTLVVREPGAAKNDLAPAALLLAAIAILINAWVLEQAKTARSESREPPTHRLPFGWPLALAGLATGLAVGTRYTAVAIAVALTAAVIALTPGARLKATAQWLGACLLGGGFWYLRNLIAVGNPLPEIENIGPVSLPHPLRVQVARPEFDVAHYAADTTVWRHYFAPGLHQAFGALWPLVLALAVGGALLAVFRGRDRLLRWVGGVALFGVVAYIFTPLTAAGAQGAPLAFAINVRYVIPALLVGIVLFPLAKTFDSARRQGWVVAGLIVVLVLTDRPDAIARDPARLFALAMVVVLVVIPAALFLVWDRGFARGAVIAGVALLTIGVVVVGYPLQRHYLGNRFANSGPESEGIPGMDLNSAYRWARNVKDARIGLAGTTAGFASYGFYGVDLSNQVEYLGATGADGAFNAIPSCNAFRRAANEAELDYLVTSPFLNFLHPSELISSPESRWLRGESSVRPIIRSGPVTVWKVTGRLDPEGCGPANAPLHEIPNAPTSSRSTAPARN